MQDQTQPKQKRPKQIDRVWGLAAVLILIASITYVWSIIDKVPHAEWRNVFKPTPWEVADVKVSEAEAYWKSSAGDTRMELRARYYPVGRIKLAKAEGEGIISVRFFDDAGNQVGDRVNVPYRNGKFVPRQDYSVQATEEELTVRLEDGFQNPDLYKLHQVDENATLWRMEFDCQPVGKKRTYLGHLSILPHDL